MALEVERIDPPTTGAEKELLEAFLDYHRATLLGKVAGLGDEELRRAWVPSGTSLLSLVKHLGYVERVWFQERFAGQEFDHPWSNEDPDADFRIEPDERTESVLAFYREQCDRSRAIVAGASLDAITKRRHERTGEEFSLRWILIHMIEETSRHNGHADILRELTDGQTGE